MLTRPLPAKAIATVLALIVTSLVGLSPARAVTCDDVRDLNVAQQDYWSKRLHLSFLQRHLIWVACYRDYRAKPVNTARW
jgi:hypothetical protein